MVKSIAVRLTPEQAKALLLTKLFDGKSPLSLRMADGVIANTACAPAIIEEGRSFWKQPRTRLLLPPNGRVRYVRSLMGGCGGDLLLEWYEKERKSPTPVRFEAKFDEPGSIHDAHDILLTLREINVEKVAAMFCGYTTVVQEIWTELGIPLTFPLLPKDENCDVEALLAKVRHWHHIREDALLFMAVEDYTLRAHLSGLSNRVGG